MIMEAIDLREDSSEIMAPNKGTIIMVTSTTGRATSTTKTIMDKEVAATMVRRESPMVFSM